MALLRLLGLLINMLAAGLGRNTLRDLDRLQMLYARMDDKQLRTELAGFLAVGFQSPQAPQRPWRWLARFQDSPELHALAISACLFDRYPCDLPPGSSAYDEQRLAALMLVEHINVQMDTGEGKTYAIVLAATALLARYPQVIILTANEYLAKRDRARVSPYFQAAGLDCWNGIPGEDFRGVAYATLGDLCFGYLRSTYQKINWARPGYPTRAAIIIDEIDSVLIDQALRNNLVRIVPSDESLWDSIFRLADQWDEEQYIYNSVSDEFSLTADAWEDVTRLSRETGKPTSLLIGLASAALWARRADEGRHYLVDNGNVHLINQVTGEPFDSAGPQQGALEYLIAGRNPPVSLPVAEIDGLTLLRRHPHVVGLSGTARDDTVYYLQQLGTLTAQVPPRFQRYKGNVVTLVSVSRETTLSYVARRIDEVQPRPVVIGTWSPAEARAIADRLRSNGVVDDSRLSVITAFGSGTDAAAIDVAGQPGRVTVLSQGGSRGVDVRSTHRPLLVVLGRAFEPRLDRQFLGRVGRHGEAFDAEFIIDPSSPVQVPFSIVSKLVGETMPLEGPVARSFSQQQRDVWSYRIRRRQQATVVSRALGEAEAATAAEFRRLLTLGGEASLQEYVAELCASPANGPDGGAGSPGLLGVAAQVTGAIQRRTASDGLVTQFEAALHAIFGPLAASYRLHRTVPGDGAELDALTRWLMAGASEFGPLNQDDEEGEEDGEGEEDEGEDTTPAMLFYLQAEAASSQYLPVRTTPYSRDPVDVVYETRLMANAVLIEQIWHRLDSLRVTSPRDGYFRRGAFTIRNLHKLADLSVRREILNNLSVVDHPAMLDELYYSRDHQMFTPGPRDSYELAAAAPAAPAALAAISEEKLKAVVAEFLNEQEQGPGGLPIPPDTARLILLEILRPLMVGTSLLSADALRQRIRLILDSLAAKGTRGGKLRDHRRLIFAFTDSLYRQGLLTNQLAHESAVTSAIRRARSFVATIPRFGVMAIAAYLGIMILGWLPVIRPSQHAAWFDTATQLFGFGASFPGRPFLAFFAILIMMQAAARASGVSDPNVLVVVRLTPILAIVISLLFYNRGVSGAGWTILLIVGLTFWSGVLFAANRFVATFVGLDANTLLAAVSVVVYVAGGIIHGQTRPYLLIVIGILAVVAGPAVPVSIGSREYARGTVRYGDDRARIRIVLDPVISSGLVATVITLAARVHGSAAAGCFVLTQLLTLGLLASRALGTDRIKGILAKLQIGTPLADSDLTSYLRRALARSMLTATIALSGAVAVSTVVAKATVPEFLLDEWAGVILFTGVLSIGSALSVAGAMTPLLHSGDDDTGGLARLRELRNQLRAWRRMRFAWIWKTAILLVAAFGILRWISDWFGVEGVLHAIWQAIVHLFQ